MSLLADLLSKIKTGASHGGNEPPSHLDVPPTLSKSHKITAKVTKFNNRYVVITLGSLAFIALGALVTAKLGLLSTSAKKKPAPSTQVGLSPPSTATSTEQSKIARISLGEPPAPVQEKKKVALHKAKSTPSPPRQPAASTAVSGAKQIERPRQQAPTQPRMKAVAPLKIDTAARDSLLYAARSAEQASDWKSALDSYRKAQEIDQGNYKIMSNVAAALNNLGMFDEGVQEAERALVKKPDYVPALINAAIGYSSRGNTQMALRHFTHASAIDPGNRSLIINLGILHERSGNLDDAQATYRQLAFSGDPLALQGMGRIYELKGNRSDAARTYRQILAMPNASPALKKEVKGKLARLEE